MSTDTLQIFVLDTQNNGDDNNIDHHNGETEIDIIYNRLKIDNPNIHPHIFDSIMQIEMQPSSNINIMSNIPAMLIKNIIGSVSLITHESISNRPSNKQNALNESGKLYHIPVQFNEPLLTLVGSNNGKTRQYASHDMINATGYVLNIDITPNMSFQSFQRRPNPWELSAMGTYSHYLYPTDHGRSQEHTYQTVPLYSATRPLVQYVFNNPNDALMKIQSTMSVIKQYNNYYQHNNPIILEWANMVSTSTLPSSIRFHSNQKTTLGVIPEVHKLFPIMNQRMGYYGFLGDIMLHNQWESYKHAQILGANHPRVKDTHRKTIINASSDNTTRIKFKRRQVYLKYLSHELFDDNFNALGTSDQNIILTKYKHEITMEDQIRTNKCQHVNLYKNVMAHAHVRGIRFPTGDWQRLKDIVPLIVNDSVNTCTICKLPALCPHYYAMFDHCVDELSKKPVSQDDQSKHGDLRDVLMKYVGTHSNSTSYYCKICGDMLIKSIDTRVGKAVDGYGYKSISFDPLEQKIWGNVTGIMNSYVHVKMATDINSLVQSVVALITPHILREESRLMQIKTNSTIVIDMTMYVYIAIYAYAALIRFISFYPKLLEFNVPSFMKRSTRSKSAPATGGNQLTSTAVDNVKPKSPTVANVRDLQRSFQIALSLILISKKSALAKIAGITDAAIKNMLIDAYKRINNIKMKRITIDRPYNIEFIMDTRWVKYIVSRLGKNKDNTVQQVLHGTVDQISKLANPFEKITSPPINIPQGSNYFGFDPVLYEKYLTTSLSGLLTYLKDAHYTKPTISLIQDENVKRAKYKEQEAKLFEHRQMVNHVTYESYFRPYDPYKYVKPHSYYNYCKDGQTHEFDIHIYSEKSKGLTEIHENDIKSWITDSVKNKKWQLLKRTDVKCSKCNVTRSSIQSTIYGKDSTKLDDHLSKIRNRDMDTVSFYNYYRNRCPAKLLHNWSTGKCEHCKITRGDILNKSTSVYNKWLKQFHSDISKQSVRQVNYYERMRKHDNGSQQWVASRLHVSKVVPVNGSAVTKLANVIDVQTSQIVYIGYSRRFKYNSIKSGKIDPSANATDADISDAVTRARRYVFIAIIEYQRIQHGDNIKLWDVPKQIFNNYRDIATTPKIDMSILQTDHLNNFGAPPTKILHQYLIGTLASILHGLINRSSPAQVDNTITFVKYVMNVIFWMEKFQSLPDRYKRSVVQNGGQTKTEDNNEEYASNEVDSTVDGFDPFGMDEVDFDSAEVFTDGNNETA
jgi:hypothetical protein